MNELGRCREKKEKLCTYCHRQILLGHFCGKCRRSIPRGFVGTITEKCNEISRNTAMKSKFIRTLGIGAMSFDMLNNIFRIGRGYYGIGELAKYNFYTKGYRVKNDVTGGKLVYTDIMLSYELKGQPRRTIKVLTGRCQTQRRGTQIYISSPKELSELQTTMRNMVSTEYSRLLDALNILNGKK